MFKFLSTAQFGSSLYLLKGFRLKQFEIVDVSRFLAIVACSVVPVSRCYARAGRTRRDHGGLGPRNNRTGGGARKTMVVPRTLADTQKLQPIETMKARQMCVYIYIQMNGVTTGKPVSDNALTPSRTHTQKCEMETLPVALGHSAE